MENKPITPPPCYWLCASPIILKCFSFLFSTRQQKDLVLLRPRLYLLVWFSIFSKKLPKVVRCAEVWCHSQSCRESGVQSTDWLLAGPRLGRLDAPPAPLLWMLLPKLVPNCRRLMWRMTAVALKACCEGRTGVWGRLLVLVKKEKTKQLNFKELQLILLVHPRLSSAVDIIDLQRNCTPSWSDKTNKNYE